MSKQEPMIRLEDTTVQDNTMQNKTVPSQQVQQLHYRIDTENCLSHTWYKPVFSVIGSNQHNGE